MATDKVMPRGKWKFDDEVTVCFDDMLERSIPQYQLMRTLCTDIAQNFIESKTDVVDMGASRGEAVAELLNKNGAHNRFILCEISTPMLKSMKERYEGLINCGVVDLRRMDFRKEFPNCSASVVLCVLTLQFTPIEYRLQILKRAYDNLLPGGAFILVEKVLGDSADIDEMMVSNYLEMKKSKGYTEDEIARKRMSLEGVLVPLTAKFNEELLEKSGFSQVDCFWRWMNFAGWVAVK